MDTNNDYEYVSDAPCPRCQNQIFVVRDFEDGEGNIYCRECNYFVRMLELTYV